MYSRWFNILVLMLWLSTMGWLVHEKVLPPLRVGEPPDYRTIVAARDNAPVGWRLSVDGQSVGWALSTTERQPNGLTEIRNLVHFDRVPLQQLTPGWIKALVRLGDDPAFEQPMEAESVLWIDPLGRLSRFDSKVRLNGDPQEFIRLKGVIEGKQAEVSLNSGSFVYTTEVSVPRDALMSDVFSPQTKLPHLRQGQSWSAPAFSPLRPPNSPMEILHATVEGLEPVSYDNRLEQVWLVVYRADSGAELGTEDNARGRMWVRRDGTVIRQEMALFESKLGFTRLSPRHAIRLHRKSTQRREAQKPRSFGLRPSFAPAPGNESRHSPPFPTGEPR